MFEMMQLAMLCRIHMFCWFCNSMTNVFLGSPQLSKNSRLQWLVFFHHISDETKDLISEMSLWYSKTNSTKNAKRLNVFQVGCINQGHGPIISESMTFSDSENRTKGSLY